MDPLAHTLFGAALAESGLKRRSRYATATLLIGANLPDVDVLAGIWGSDFELYARPRRAPAMPPGPGIGVAEVRVPRAASGAGP